LRISLDRLDGRSLSSQGIAERAIADEPLKAAAQGIR
jgi:hypothetical protein